MSKKTYNKPKRVQFLYFLLFFISGGILFYIKTLPDQDQSLGVMLVLLAILMYSLLKSTKNWAYDNPKPKEEEESEEKPVYKEKNIPSLEEMTKNLQDKNPKKL